MKAGITSDWHYGLSVEELDRSPEIHTAVNFIIDRAIKEKVDFFVIGGDLVDNNTPIPDHIALIIRVLNKLEDAEIPTFVLKGNHCAISASNRQWGLRPLEEVGYQNIHFITSPKLMKVKDSVLLFLPHVTRAQSLAENFKSPQEYMDHYAEKLLEEAGTKVTAFTHTNVTGSKIGSESRMLRQTDLQLPAILTRSPQVINIFNGHIHTPQIMNKVIMPGSPVCTDFGDVDENKGFLIGELKEKWECEVIKTPQAPLQEFELDFLGKKTAARKKLLQEALKLVQPDAIVKLRILIEEENLPTIDNEVIAKPFMEKAKYIKSVDRIVSRKRSVRDVEQKCTLSPVDAVKLYIEKRNPDGAPRKLNLALKILDQGKVEPKMSEGAFMNETAAHDLLDESLAQLDTDIAIPETV
jgi:DNA repair exonuclease SbcCD nuclease subunit